MTATRKKLQQAQYFYEAMEQLFRHDRPEFEFHVDAFLNAARNVTFIMNKEYGPVPAYEGWLETQELTKSKLGMKFVTLRNISLKERSISHKHFEIRFNFGPEGIKGKGNTSITSPVIEFGTGEIPDFVTVKDEDEERQIKANVIHDFVVEEHYDSGKKKVSSESFIKEASMYLEGLTLLVDECEKLFRPK